MQRITIIIIVIIMMLVLKVLLKGNKVQSVILELSFFEIAITNYSPPSFFLPADGHGAF